jgi:hypothetical protein
MKIQFYQKNLNRNRILGAIRPLSQTPIKQTQDLGSRTGDNVAKDSSNLIEHRRVFSFTKNREIPSMIVEKTTIEKLKKIKKNLTLEDIAGYQAFRDIFSNTFVFFNLKR